MEKKPTNYEFFKQKVQTKNTITKFEFKKQDCHYTYIDNKVEDIFFVSD